MQRRRRRRRRRRSKFRSGFIFLDLSRGLLLNISNNNDVENLDRTFVCIGQCSDGKVEGQGRRKRNSFTLYSSKSPEKVPIKWQQFYLV